MSVQDLIWRTRSQSVQSDWGCEGTSVGIIKNISPFLQHHLIVLLPLLFEIGGKLVPNREEGAGRDLLLSRLGFDGEGHAQLREPAEEHTAPKGVYVLL